MNPRPRKTSSQGSLPSHFLKVDEICDAFEAAWQEGREPLIEDFLCDADDAYHDTLFQELLVAEWDLLRQQGRPLEINVYVDRFPHETEWMTRLWKRRHPSESQGSRRPGVDRDENVGPVESSGLSVRCPNCHHVIQLSVEGSFSKVTCPSCGSHFNLTEECGAAQDLEGLRQVGHFELLENLGVGAFGTVWKGHDLQLDRTVAVKIPRRGRLRSDEIEKFLREARAAAQLSHPNIVSIHEVGRDGETVYIVSDFVHGVPLSDYMADHRFSPREAAALCATIGEALNHAHQSGVIHRDLKPSNVLIDAHGRPHLTDFGLARREAGEMTMTCDGELLGTPAYMSPEQARGEAHHADRRSDVYSLGVILFQLLTGELPFRGNVRMLIHQVVHEDPPSPRRLNSHVPRDLETICLKCLEKDPRHRYSTAREVTGELNRYLSGKPILARPVSRAAQVLKWCRRNPVTASLTVALASALTWGLIGITWQWTQTKAEAERHRQLLYVSDIAKIAEAWKAGSVGVALDLLERHVPRPGERDLRGFEWYHLWKRCQPSLLANTLEREPLFGVFAMAVSPNGQFLAAAGGPGTVIVWDLRTSKILHRLEGHQNAVLGVAFSPDSQVLASSGRDGKTYLWNVDTGEQVDILPGGSNGVDFSADGQLLAVCEGEGITVWDVSKLNNAVKRHFLSTPAPRSAMFSPDSSVLASGGEDGLIRLWGTASGEPLGPPLKGHSGHVFSVKFSPEDETLALVSSSADKTVRLWDVATRTQLAKFEGHAGHVRSATFSPDGKTVASGSFDGTAMLWDVASGGLLDTIRGHEFMLYSVAFAPGGRTLFTGSADGTVRRWDLTTRAQPVVFEGNVGPIAFAPSGRLLAAARRDSEVTLWDLTNGKEVATFRGHSQQVHDLQFSPDGQMVASASWSEGAKLWDVETLREIHELDGSRTVAFSPDGSVLATGGPGGGTTIRLWDVASGTLQLMLTGIGERDLHSLAFSPDGRILAFGGRARTGNFVLWDVLTGKELAARAGHLGPVVSVAFSPDGKIVCTGGSDGKIKLWNARTWKELETRIEGRHVAWINSVAFSRDGRTLVSGSQDGTIRLWHVATGGQLLTLEGHTGSVESVAFSPDAALLASGSGDGTIRLWPAATQEDLAEAGW